MKRIFILIVGFYLILIGILGVFPAFSVQPPWETAADIILGVIIIIIGFKSDK